MKEHAMHDTNAPQGPSTAMRELRATMQDSNTERGHAFIGYGHFSPCFPA
jgi:hypothetical protein